MKYPQKFFFVNEREIFIQKTGNYGDPVQRGLCKEGSRVGDDMECEHYREMQRAQK